MGLNKDLKLQGNDFTNAATAFYIAYLIAEIPIGLLIQRLPAAKFLGVAVICWGVATACTAAAKDYHTFLVARVFLGFFEAAIAPCLMLISSQWYTKPEQPPRFSVWYCGLGVGQIIGGIVSYAFQQIHHPDFAGWRIMFIVLGLVTVVIGINTFLFLPDTPMTAGFLDEHERIALLKHVSINQTGIQNKHFQFSQLLELLADAQIWLMVILTVLTSVSSGVITTYSTTIIRNFGYSPSTSALLTMPSGIVSITSTLVVGFGIRNTSHRWAWIVACCIVGTTGGALMSFAPLDNHAALLAGIYMVNAIVATLAIIYQWTAANSAGHTKRAAAFALVAAAFSCGNIIGPQTFQARDAPQYIPAKISILVTQAAAAVVSAVLFAYYVWANRRKDAGDPPVTESADLHSEKLQRQWRNQTDKENGSFRYVY